MTIDKATLRLELLKLTHNNVHTSEEIIGRAKAFESYVLEGEKSEVKEEVKTAAPKKGGGHKNEDKLFT